MQQARRESLFPTDLYTLEGVLEDPTSMLWTADCTQDHSLHLRPESRELVARIEELSSLIVKQQHWQIEGMEITGMWSNLNRQGEVHLPHTHSNNLLSGVYYPTGSPTQIEFFDPRPAAAVLHPRVSEYTRSNSKVWPHTPLPNSMIMFPSWLEHYVPPHGEAEPRLSIAFNLMVRGRLGSRDELQSADFG